MHTLEVGQTNYEMTTAARDYLLKNSLILQIRTISEERPYYVLVDGRDWTTRDVRVLLNMAEYDG